MNGVSATAKRTAPGLGLLVFRSLMGFRAMHIALALGIAAATAVIVGALIVGDSVRGSLRSMVEDRLGGVQASLMSQKFFHPSVLEKVRTTVPEPMTIEPAILLPSASIEMRRDKELTRASQVQVLGVESSFWQSASDPRKKMDTVELAVDEVAINESLANDLGAKIGDEISIRFPKATAIPADNPLGRRDDASNSLPRQKVVAILPDRSIASIDFRSGQNVARNVFVALSSLQSALEQEGKVNTALLIDSDSLQGSTLAQSQAICDQMNLALEPSLEDFGFKLVRNRRIFPDPERGEQAPDGSSDTPPVVVYDYFQISSDQLIIDNFSMGALQQGLTAWGAERSLTYLINEIVSLDDPEGNGAKATYSIAAGIEGIEQYFPPGDLSASPTFGLGRNGCLVNSWLAKRLKLGKDSTIQLTFFRPETIEGREIESTIQMRVAGIVPIEEPVSGFRRNKPAKYAIEPTIFNDPNITPVVPGVTDQDSISKWDLPFKLTRDIPPEDDKYWNDHRLTPKIFLNFQSAAREFRSRFGEATSIKVDAKRVSGEEEVRRKAQQALLHTKAAIGLQFVPIRQLQLQAATGTTPFDGLFLALSFFVIVAALMLVTLLFRLGLEQRSSQWGLLLSTGFTVGRVRRIIVSEAVLIALMGSAFGILLGIAYAWAMITGLETWWIGAIGSQFLGFHVTIQSILIGLAIGAITSLVTIVVTLRQLRTKQPLNLLKGQWQSEEEKIVSGNKASLAIAGFLFFGAVGSSLFGTTQSGMAQAGAFFGCGMLLLTSGIVAISYMLKSQRGAVGFSTGLFSLAWSSLCRNPWRSVLSIGLLSVATFLIASMSIFQIAPDAAGSGGYELIGQSALPIFRNIGSNRVREEVLSQQDAQSLRTTNVISFRARLGEDASCNNLFQVQQPTILGAPFALHVQQSALAPAMAFQWAARQNSNTLPWEDLHRQAFGTLNDPIPVVLDQNTAAWSLHQGAAIGSVIKLQFEDRIIHFQTVGLLSNSVLQGKLIIGADNFSRLFPEINGYQYFLIRTENKNLSRVMELFENGWSDEGLDLTYSREVLAKLLAVQNTYISAFQTIGALGLLLGTLGLAVVQLRSVLERRKELALLQAIGFSRLRISWLLLSETLLLLVGGMLLGLLTALAAVVPYLLSGNADPGLLSPIIMLTVVFSAGLLAAVLAVRAALRQPVLANLRA